MAWMLRASYMSRLWLASATLRSFVTEALGVQQAIHSGRRFARAPDQVGGQDVAQPRLYFLFMAEAGLPTEDIWVRFFRDQENGVDYEARVHCQEPDVCDESIQHPEIFRLIPTVKSEYCADLASPMLALLEATSLHGAGHPRDKFIFVAANAVPVKPYREVLQRLTADESSDFCIAPVDQWLYTRKNRRIVKHHQWTVLSRKHASILTRNFSYGVEVFASRAFNLVNPEPCLDEYWAFGAIFGHIQLPSTGIALLTQDGTDLTSVHTTLGLGGVNGLLEGRLDFAGQRSTENQGRCDTFVDAPVSGWWFSLGQSWSDFAGVNFSNVSRVLHAPELAHVENRSHRSKYPREESKLLSLAGGAPLSLLQTQGPKGPQRIEVLTQAGLRALRHSQFLFARKMDPAFTMTAGMRNMSLLEALEKYVFAE